MSTEFTYILDDHAESPHRHTGENGDTFIYPWEDWPAPTYILDDLPDQLIVNKHHFIHVASCPCPRIQREVKRLEEEAPEFTHEPWCYINSHIMMSCSEANKNYNAS